MSAGAGGVQGALTALAGTGVSEVAITELDIAGGAANDFATAVKACLAVTACVGITVGSLFLTRIYILTIITRFGVSATKIPGVQAPLLCFMTPTTSQKLHIQRLCQHWRKFS